MKLNLEQLESRLQALIEVRLVSVLPGFQIEDLMVQKLASAMKSNLVEDASGNKLVPNVYTLIVNPRSAMAATETIRRIGQIPQSSWRGGGTEIYIAADNFHRAKRSQRIK